MTMTPNSCVKPGAPRPDRRRRRLPDRDLDLAALVAARLDFVSDLTADRLVAGVSIVVCLGCVYWWAAGPRGMMRDRYFVLVPCS